MRVSLEDDARDHLLVIVVKTRERAFDIEHEDHRFLKRVDAVVADPRAKDFARDDRGQPSDSGRDAQVTPEHRERARAVEREFGIRKIIG